MVRRRSLFEEVADCSWHVGAGLAAISWICLRYVAPSLEFANPFFAAFANAAPVFAPWAALLFGAAALCSAVKSAQRARLIASSGTRETFRRLPWIDFERLVGEAYRRKGYDIEERGGDANGDGGVDLVLRRKGTKTLVQCKRWERPVGVGPVREFLGAMTAESASRGVLVSSGTFTIPAVAFAREHRIELVDGKALERLIDSSSAVTRPMTPDLAAEGLRASRRVVRRTAPSVGVSSCPKCGGGMRTRTARRGRSAGRSFLGCMKFPACRGTRSIGT